MRYEANLTETDRVVATGVWGVMSHTFTKRFRNLAAFRKWAESDKAANYEIQSVERDWSRS
jgi:hypothetical protein